MELTYAKRATDDLANLALSDTADRITVEVLGGLRVGTGLTTTDQRDLGGTKLRRLLLALLLQRGAPVSKDRLIALLWEGSPPRGAMATLESYVCVLRKNLQPGQQSRPSLITTASGCYAIDMSRVDLDLVRYEQLMSQALSPEVSATDALPILERAMTLAESPLLPGEADCEWLDGVRRVHCHKVRTDQIAAATKVAALTSDRGQRWARLALEGDRLDESAWQALLASIEASGQHADGLREYDDCRRLFAAELGCAPGPRLQALYLRLLRGANDDDQELSLLIAAVVRLHRETQTIDHNQGRTPTTRRVVANDRAAGLEQARQVVTQLLRTVSGGPHQSSMTLGA